MWATRCCRCSSPFLARIQTGAGRSRAPVLSLFLSFICVVNPLFVCWLLLWGFNIWVVGVWFVCSCVSCVWTHCECVRASEVGR